MKKHFVCVKPTRCQVSGNNPKKPRGETVIFVNKIQNCQQLEREQKFQLKNLQYQIVFDKYLYVYVYLWVLFVLTRSLINLNTVIPDHQIQLVWSLAFFDMLGGSFWKLLYYIHFIFILILQIFSKHFWYCKIYAWHFNWHFSPWAL